MRNLRRNTSTATKLGSFFAEVKVIAFSFAYQNSTKGASGFRTRESIC